MSIIKNRCGTAERDRSTRFGHEAQQNTLRTLRRGTAAPDSAKARQAPVSTDDARSAHKNLALPSKQQHERL